MICIIWIIHYVNGTRSEFGGSNYNTKKSSSGLNFTVTCIKKCIFEKIDAFNVCKITNR